MQHLDEGTIHAWLDGALDTTRSREIEAHLAQCPACSAAVAEARGLVAASSRILTALDDVPAGVVPKRVASPPMKVARRQWRAAPWVSGIAAAALLFAIGIKSVNKSSEVSFKDEAMTVAPQVSVQTDTAATRVLDSAAPLSAPASPTRLATSGPTAPPPTAAARRDLAANQAQTETRRTAAADASTLRASVGEGAKVVVTAAPEAPSEVKLEKSTVKSVPAAPEQLVAGATGVRESRMNEESVAARLAGCYRIDPEMLRQSVAAEGGVTGSVAAAARGRAAAPAAAADRSTQRYTTRAASVPTLVRLDTARHPLGYAARDARSDTLVGGWRNVGRDSARVDMVMVDEFVFSLRNRVSCPER